MGAPSQWFYRTEGAFEDSTHGPISEDEVAELIRTRKVKPTTLLASPTVTNGQWFQLSKLDFTQPLARYEARAEQQRRKEDQARQAEQAARQAAEARLAREENERKEREAALRQQQLQEAQRARAQFLESIRDRQRRYRVLVADPNQAERACDSMGIEGWELEAAFAETFTYPQCGGCCQPEVRRQFVFVFSQPLHARPQ